MEKKLQRSRKKRVLAGIAGGLSDYLDIDPVIIRVVIVLVTIFHGFGLIVYIIMWIIIPEEPFDMSFADKDNDFGENSDKSFSENMNAGAQSVFDEASKAAEKISSNSSNGRVIVGAVLILIGLLFLSEKFFPFLDFEFVFAVGLIVLGLSLLFNFFNKSEKSS